MDSNTVIDFLNKKLPVAGKNLVLSTYPIISVITEIELFSSNKTPEEELKQLRSFVSDSIIYRDINESMVKRAIDLRKKHRLKTPDAIIAATAIVNSLTLISRNKKDFGNIPELILIDPWSL